MIKTVGDFLQALKKIEEQRISSFIPIPHAPTIGAMYEGATRQLLDNALFDGLNLTISNGFIKNSKGQLSKQIDCLIGIGHGTVIPYTNNCIYDLSDVIAVVEVKKNLYGSELENAMDWSRDFKNRIWESPMTHKANLVRDAWRSITGQELPEPQNVSSLPYYLEMIYHNLIVESSMPLRIFIGYEGYISEGSFRNGLLKYLDDLVIAGKHHLGGPGSLPDVMICRDSSIFRLNGMPYPGPMTPKGYWLYLGSRGINPLYILLEFVWTRLSYKFGISSDIFGEDLEREGVNPLLLMKAVQVGEKQGWTYEYFTLSDEKLTDGNTSRPWEPVEVSEMEASILFVLGKKHEININDLDFVNYVSCKGATLTDIIKSLSDKRLIYYQNNVIRYLTDTCVVIILPDGKAVAGDNKSGQMTRWMLKQDHNK
jgi:hypothetical protein